MCAPASAVGDAPEFLDVDVDQLAWPVAFVADRGGLRRSDDLAGERVALVQPRHTVAAKDAGDRACRDTDVGGELIGPAAAFTASGQDAFFDLWGGLVGDRVRSRRSVFTRYATRIPTTSAASSPSRRPIKKLLSIPCTSLLRYT